MVFFAIILFGKLKSATRKEEMEDKRDKAIEKLKGLAFLLDAVDDANVNDGVHKYHKEGVKVLKVLCDEIVEALEG